MRHEVAEVHCQNSDGSAKETLRSGRDPLLICRAGTRVGSNPAQLRVQHGRYQLLRSRRTVGYESPHSDRLDRATDSIPDQTSLQKVGHN
jgi:hypothetical protein